MFVKVSFDNYLSVDCPTCGYRHSCVDKFYTERREFKCSKCGSEWDLVPTVEKAYEIEMDLQEIKRCAKSLHTLALKYKYKNYEPLIEISKELL
jgi:DNA-directed RNA polymerase subunit RPC12/RpoP